MVLRAQLEEVLGERADAGLNAYEELYLMRWHQGCIRLPFNYTAVHLRRQLPLEEL